MLGTKLRLFVRNFKTSSCPESNLQNEINYEIKNLLQKYIINSNKKIEYST